MLRGQRLGLLCHPASVTRGLDHAVDVVRQLRGARLVRLFAPEHGLAGTAQDQIGTARERAGATRLPVVSLYDGTAASLAPTARALAGLDALVVDLQDVGSRYYTFVWTMVLAMRACAAAGVRVVVLDRPNPLGGEQLEGNIAEPGWTSFVGLHPLPIRHGLTIAEVAAWVNARHAVGCALTTIAMRGWRRRMRWEDTGLPWVPPSPNMPTPDTARVYPGGCLLEGTNLSEGRGTTRPFEWVGAPYLDGARLAGALERRGLPGVRFRAAAFEPTFHKWRGLRCGGVQVHVTDPARFRPFASYVALIAEARRQGGRAFRWRRPPYEFERRRRPFDLLAGGPTVRRAIERGVPLARLEAAWRPGLRAFARARRPYLLYR